MQYSIKPFTRTAKGKNLTITIAPYAYCTIMYFFTCCAFYVPRSFLLLRLHNYKKRNEPFWVTHSILLTPRKYHFCVPLRTLVCKYIITTPNITFLYYEGRPSINPTQADPFPTRAFPQRIQHCSHSHLFFEDPNQPS